MLTAIEHNDIGRIVTQLFHALDDHDWTLIEQLCLPEIDVEYPAKQGGPTRMSATDLTSELQDFLPGFDATQHLVGHPVIKEERDRRVTANIDVQVTHALGETSATSDIYTIGVRYLIGLAQAEGDWKIASSRARVVFQSGDPRLLEEARLRCKRA